MHNEIGCPSDGPSYFLLRRYLQWKKSPLCGKVFWIGCGVSRFVGHYQSIQTDVHCKIVSHQLWTMWLLVATWSLSLSQFKDIENHSRGNADWLPFCWR
jgi:hypothetical protein